MNVLLIPIDFLLVICCNTTVFSSLLIEPVQVLLDSFYFSLQNVSFSLGIFSLEIKQSLVVISKSSVHARIIFVASDNIIVDCVFIFGYSEQSFSCSKTVNPELLNAFLFIAGCLVRLLQFGNERDVLALVIVEGTTVLTVREPGQVSVEVALSG